MLRLNDAHHCEGGGWMLEWVSEPEAASWTDGEGSDQLFVPVWVNQKTATEV